jgi:sec-independent protein translocase protein TatA
MQAVGPFGLGLPEMLLIFGVVVLIFGVGKMADVGGALGRSIREFRKEAAKQDDDDDSEVEQITSSSSTEAGTKVK